MWAGGIAICAYLFFLPGNNMPTSYAPVIPVTKSVPSPPNSLKNNDAYVFINVDKKHFLTRFVASVAPQEIKNAVNKNSSSQVITVNTAVERVSKKPQPAAVNNTTGFSIKPVPGI
jgi:hypothetical protein